MTLKELTRLVALGEGPHLEFKRKVPRPERIAKEVIAFANSDGGRVLLGVADDGEIAGVRDAAEEEFAFREALHRHVTPPVRLSTVRVPVTAKRDVILINVPASGDRPHFLVDDPAAGAGHAYVRVGDMSVEASSEAIRLMRTSENGDVLFEFGEKEHLLMRYLHQYGRITVEQFASVAGVPMGEASATLVRLAQARVVELHHDPRADYFTPGFDEKAGG